jgi:hypothetical protein
MSLVMDSSGGNPSISGSAHLASAEWCTNCSKVANTKVWDFYATVPFVVRFPFERHLR